MGKPCNSHATNPLGVYVAFSLHIITRGQAQPVGPPCSDLNRYTVHRGTIAVASRAHRACRTTPPYQSEYGMYRNSSSRRGDLSLADCLTLSLPVAWG